MGRDLVEYYVWTEVDDGGTEGVIATLIPDTPHWGMLPLATRSRAVAEGPFAKAASLHQQASGHRVRLVRWTAREVLADLN